MKLQFIFILFLLFICPASTFSESQITQTELVIPESILGDAIVGLDEANYRIPVEHWDGLVALYPAKFDGNLELDVAYITSVSEINVIIQVAFLFSEPYGDAYTTSRFVYYTLNETIQANTTFSFPVSEIDYNQGFQYTLENGTKIPGPSYNYLEEVNTDSYIFSSVEIQLEQSNHLVPWNSEIKLQGKLTFSHDPQFQQVMLDRQNSATKVKTYTGRVNSSLIAIIGLNLVAISYFKKYRTQIK